MTISLNDLEKAAWDARVELTSEEKEELQEELELLLKQIKTMSENLKPDIDPLFYTRKLENTLRVDDKETSLPREKVLENAPDSNESCFLVPKIIEE